MDFINRQDVRKILELAYRRSSRDHLILLLSFQHGLRESEVAAIQLDDIQDGFLRVVRRKGSLTTRQPLKTDKDPLFDASGALAVWMEERDKNAMFTLFTSRNGGGMLSTRTIRQLSRYYMLAAGIPKHLAHHHSLKHACVEAIRRSGVAVEYVRQWVGHKDIKNTLQYYTHITDKEAAVQASPALGS